MLPLSRPAVNEIPRILHQIWIGSPPPAWVRRTWATWDVFMEEHHGDWTIQRWTDNSLDSVGSAHPLVRTLRAAGRVGMTPRGTADLLRVQAVSLFGGLYFDSDTVPLQPLDRFVGDRGGWIGTAPRTEGTRTIANASFGFPAGHPFLGRVWEYAEDALARGVHSDSHIAGPHAWRKVLSSTSASLTVDYTFANEWDRDLQRTMGAGKRFDLDALRLRFPEVPVLHIVFYTRVEGFRP